MTTSCSGPSMTAHYGAAADAHGGALQPGIAGSAGRAGGARAGQRETTGQRAVADAQALTSSEVRKHCDEPLEVITP